MLRLRSAPDAEHRVNQPFLNFYAGFLQGFVHSATATAMRGRMEAHHQRLLRDFGDTAVTEVKDERVLRSLRALGYIK